MTRPTQSSKDKRKIIELWNTAKMNSSVQVDCIIDREASDRFAWEKKQLSRVQNVKPQQKLNKKKKCIKTRLIFCYGLLQNIAQSMLWSRVHAVYSTFSTAKYFSMTLSMFKTTMNGLQKYKCNKMLAIELSQTKLSSTDCKSEFGCVSALMFDKPFVVASTIGWRLYTHTRCIIQCAIERKHCGHCRFVLLTAIA